MLSSLQFSGNFPCRNALDNNNMICQWLLKYIEYEYEIFVCFKIVNFCVRPGWSSE